MEIRVVLSVNAAGLANPPPWIHFGLCERCGKVHFRGKFLSDDLLAGDRPFSSTPVPPPPTTTTTCWIRIKEVDITRPRMAQGLSVWLVAPQDIPGGQHDEIVLK